jgi:hypothetical protein
MAYLLPLQDDLGFAVQYLLSQHGEKVSAGDLDWLRSEIEHLIGSAAQEKAVQYSNSTATPVDEWSYAEDTVGFLRNSSRKHKMRASSDSLDSEEFIHGFPNWSRKRPKRSQRTWLVPTASGQIEIYLPSHRKPGKDVPQGLDDVGLRCKLVQNHTTFVISARFLRDLKYAGRAKICGQLNVYVQVGRDVTDRYDNIMRKATLSEFDAALRGGEISPFHIESALGLNICLYVSSS